MLLYVTFFHLCTRQLDYGVAGEASAAVARHLADFLDILTPHALGHGSAGGSWSLFGALGLSSNYVMSPRARFLALSIVVFLRGQVRAESGGVRYKR